MSDVQILTPVGRMVQGDPFLAQDKDHKGRPLTDKHGKPRLTYFFAIAIPKTDPGYPAMLQQIQQVAVAGFPGGQYNRQDFAWKIEDGDAPDNVEKTGFAGHWVLRCSGGFPIKVYTKGGAELIHAADPAKLKRGDYIRAYLSVKPNGDTTDNPGIFLNPIMIEVCGYGEEIVGGPSGAAVFGGNPVGALPPGASATPVAGTPIAAPGAAVPAMAPGAAPGAAVPPPGMPGATMGTVAPMPTAAGAGAGMAPGIPTPPAPTPAPAVPQMTQKAGGATYEQMIAAGWTDQAMIDQGFMIPTAPGVQPAPGFVNGQ